jgi:hypothetical protein
MPVIVAMAGVGGWGSGLGVPERGEGRKDGRMTYEFFGDHHQGE